MDFGYSDDQRGLAAQLLMAAQLDQDVERVRGEARDASSKPAVDILAAESSGPSAGAARRGARTQR